MTAADRPVRKDAATWTAAGLIASAAVLVVGLSHPSSVAPSPTPGSDGPSASAAAAARPPPIESRAAVFRARLAAYAAAEPQVRRAFLEFQPPPPARPHRAAVRAMKVAPGGTPQACLAQAVYYEARGEPREGQAAVAQVVLNRARSGSHPASVCGVVFEGASRPGCQFSFACDGRLGGRKPGAEAWRRAETVAAEALDGRQVAGVGGALNYHADYVRPRWAAQLQRTAEIGRHIFYAAIDPLARAASAWSAPPRAAEPASPTD